MEPIVIIPQLDNLAFNNNSEDTKIQNLNVNPNRKRKHVKFNPVIEYSLPPPSLSRRPSRVRAKSPFKLHNATKHSRSKLSKQTTSGRKFTETRRRMRKSHFKRHSRTTSKKMRKKVMTKASRSSR